MFWPDRNSLRSELSRKDSAITDRAQRVRAWIDDRADEMAEALIRLVACETENPPGRGLAECAEILRAEMDRLGLDPEIVEIEPTGTIEDPRIVRGNVCNGAKGALSMRVDVHGRPVHVGQAFKGVNSFVHMLKVAGPLEAYAQQMS